MEVFDQLPKQEDFGETMIEGLSSTPKWALPKFFYDYRGSQLFDQICDQPEYYQTRTELGILSENNKAIVKMIPENSLLIEYGSGVGKKIRLLLDNAPQIAAYMPVDISKEFLIASCETLSRDYPQREIFGVVADYTQGLELPNDLSTRFAEKVVFFPGSTLGNLDERRSKQLLTAMTRLIHPRGSLLIGIDLVKDESILNSAYNDAAGVTAAFNLNLLERCNRELGADFDLSQFAHHAYYNHDEQRIEMHLRSLRQQQVRFLDRTFDFAKDETIHTENSHKFLLPEFESWQREVGFEVKQTWKDPKGHYAVQWYRYES